MALKIYDDEPRYYRLEFEDSDVPTDGHLDVILREEHVWAAPSGYDFIWVARDTLRITRTAEHQLLKDILATLEKLV